MEAAKPAPKRRKTKANRLTEALEADADKDEEAEPRGVVYLGSLPNGFFEPQMKTYFSQFGEVTRFRLSRSPKTGGSKGFGFIEFRQESVAKIVAQTMNKYLLGDRSLVCKFKPKDECHPKMFKGWRRKPFDPRPRRREKQMLSVNDRPTVEVDGQAVPQLTELQVKHHERRRKKLKGKLRQLEIDYDVDEILNGGGTADNEAEAEEPEAQEQKQPKKKKRRRAAVG
ncbi:unnamed protein product [Durusdinium trenchii]|uniref:RRM domain-containing protein n=1 Tax=Durusdinium trenchii TaxID=1381693 RepID=A0ABP0P248_9DINO